MAVDGLGRLAGGGVGLLRWPLWWRWVVLRWLVGVTVGKTKQGEGEVLRGRGEISEQVCELI